MITGYRYNYNYEWLMGKLMKSDNKIMKTEGVNPTTSEQDDKQGYDKH